MMPREVPTFMDSPYLIIDEKGWRLKDNAPEKVKEEFKEFMDSLKMMSEGD